MLCHLQNTRTVVSIPLGIDAFGGVTVLAGCAQLTLPRSLPLRPALVPLSRLGSRGISAETSTGRLGGEEASAQQPFTFNLNKVPFDPVLLLSSESPLELSYRSPP